MNIYAVIMAGGGGTRFWPLSRKSNPKQLLNLSGKDVMINETVTRLNKAVDGRNVYIVTNALQREKIIETTAGKVLPENVFSEPCARNTAACIGYAAVKLLKERGDGVMIVTPSDAYVKDEDLYAEILKTAAAEAERTDGIITVGIKPTFPATGYGYIRYKRGGGRVSEVLSFVEKPDAATAKKYFDSGEYVWNGGIFVWKASVALENIRKFMPELYEGLMKIAGGIGTEKETETTAEIYPVLPSVSIDYGVMEKADGIKVITGDFGWNDVGSWDMMEALHETDENGNVSVGDAVLMDTTGSAVYSSGRTVAVLGLDGVVVVETPDAVLVCGKDEAQNVKKIVDELKKRGRENLL